MNDKEKLYRKNQKSIKVLGIVTPIVFWVCIALAIIFFIVALSQSITNINEIYDLLDSKTYNDTQIAENYNYLCNKYGELVVGQGTSGFTIHFVNFKSAIFNALIVSMVILSEVFLIAGFFLGKWFLPYYKKKLESSNQDMVNLTILQNMPDKE